ncbi:hypothetical protein Gotur_009354 [Gossypium turneri]
MVPNSNSQTSSKNGGIGMDHHLLRSYQKKFKTYGPNSLTNLNLNQTKNTFTEQSIFSQNYAFLRLFLGITPMNKIHILEFHY